MIGKFLSKIGATLLPPVGGVHDALWSADDEARPAKYEQVKKFAKDQDLTWTGENMANTLAFYVGGTAAVAALVAFAISKLKKPKMRYIRSKAKRTYRRKR